MTVTTWLAVAWAGAPEALGPALGRYPDAAIAAVCSPYSAVAERLGGSEQLARLQGPGEVWSSLLDPELAATFGVDPDGELVFVGHDAGGPAELSLPFSGTPDQARELVRRFDPRATGGDGRWTLSLGGKPHLAVHHDGRFVLVAGSVRPPEGEARASGLLGELPEVAGCSVWLPKLPPSPKGGPAIDEVAAFVPLSGGAPAVFRVRTPLPAELFRTDAPVPVGRGPEAPTGVLTLSAPLGAWVRSVSEQLPGAKGGDPTAKLGLESGLSAALWGDPKDGGSWAGLFVLTDRKGRPIPPARLSRLAAKALASVGAERLGRDGLHLTGLAGMPLWARFADDGRVAFGSTPLAPSLALSTTGEPWLDEAAATAAREVPLRMSLAGPEATIAMALSRYSDDALQLVIDLRLDDAGRAELRAQLAPVLDAVVPALLSGKPPGP